MSTTLGNGIVTFGDGTSLHSSQIQLGNVSGAPANLSSFTNNLGNYGGFFDSTYFSATKSGNAGGGEYGPRFLYWNGSQLQITASNCNCNCNC